MKSWKTRWALPLLSAMVLGLAGVAGWTATSPFYDSESFSVTGQAPVGGSSLTNHFSATAINWAIVPAVPGKMPVVDRITFSSFSNSASLVIWKPWLKWTVADTNLNHGWTNLVLTSTNGSRGPWATGDVSNRLARGSVLVFHSVTNDTFQRLLAIGVSTNSGASGHTNVLIVETNSQIGGFYATPRAGDAVWLMYPVTSRDFSTSLGTPAGTPMYAAGTNALGGLLGAAIEPPHPIVRGVRGGPLLIELGYCAGGSASATTTNRIWSATGSYE